jgi:ASCH domain
LLCEYDTEGLRPPQVGDLSIVTDWDGLPLCVIETTEVEVQAFQDVDEDFAADEGEGDLSLKYWKDVHWAYFERVCQNFGEICHWRYGLCVNDFRWYFLCLKDSKLLAQINTYKRGDDSN